MANQGDVKTEPLPNTPPTIEVERKFTFTDSTEDKLQEQGASLIQQKTFTDIYYDVPQYSLTLSDHWLRQRDGVWELKCPPENPTTNDLSQVTCQYAEHVTIPEIIAKCSAVLGLAIPTDSSMQEFLTSAQCGQFATIKTERKSYSLNEFSVDLDTADFGFRVGEIEVLVLEENKIADALSRIDMLAKTLGVGESKKLPGKLSAYLQRFRPEHYKTLLQHEIIPEVRDEHFFC
ncbi:thiamine-triphosphatase-like isoform X1 [Lingula anatina]|uniref:Thiamine-triphosphatase n=1 Tax=Lingula anatina TaxID=7574 RepID=A0A1S3HYD9_LINAN|nr:thiamine-triphosphatase-like isoform X1 [Lingula anatina]|eukprot:XP_013391028.1 thiamine-triphosphatase-like isoform X1 [Lingula anatina]